ncbi:MAG: tetratricopeptide repeat protein [Granulosicoccus sp.]
MKLLPTQFAKASMLDCSTGSVIGSACTRSLRHLASGALPVMLLGCSAMPMTPQLAHADQQTPSTKPAEVSLDAKRKHKTRQETGQLMYELMIAELAGRRGYLDVAMAGYLRAAEKTDDPRVADRATRLAAFARQWSAAEGAARRWLKLDPDVLEAHEILAQSLLKQNKTDEATAELKQLVNIAGSKPAALQGIQSLLQHEAESADVIAIMQVLADSYPDEIEGQLGVARLALDMNKRKVALQAIESALALDSRNGDALLINAQILSAMGQPEEGLGKLEAALTEDKGNIALRLGYAQMLIASDRFEAASKELDSLAEQAGDNADVLLTISLLALDAKRTDAAERYLSSLLETGEHQNQAYYYLARIADQQQNFADAIPFYESVQPGDLYLIAQMRGAELLALTGELDQGRERLHQLASVVSDTTMLPALLTTESRMLLEAGQLAEAVQVLTKGLENVPDNGELLYARALAADQAGNQKMLEDDLAQLIELEPDNASALNALGYHLAEEDLRLDEAADYLERANKLQPEDPAIMDSLGWLRYRQGDFTSSIELLREAYALYPDGEIAAHLGEVLWSDGDRIAAKEIWQKALGQSPDDEILQRVVQKYVADPAAIGIK